MDQQSSNTNSSLPGSASPIPQAVVEEKVREAVAESLELEVDEVQLDSSLFEELGAESLDLLDATFILEREFKIQFPRTDILERATQLFGEDTLMVDGVITEFGVKLLRMGMPEVDADEFYAGMPTHEIARKITVQSLVRITTRLLEAKAAYPRECPSCGATCEESAELPELVCPECGETVLLPNGDEIMLDDMQELIEKTTPA